MSASMAARLGVMSDQYRRNHDSAFSARQKEGVTPEDRAMLDERVRAAESVQREIRDILAAEDDRLEHRQWRA